ncbi:hypothetical protein E4T56_gene3283 [Termitomyces sp. T112]|nr:hypothetical protein E4T56_gene3283 [Termitomyces sp. T112]
MWIGCPSHAGQKNHTIRIISEDPSDFSILIKSIYYLDSSCMSREPLGTDIIDSFCTWGTDSLFLGCIQLSLIAFRCITRPPYLITTLSI